VTCRPSDVITRRQQFFGTMRTQADTTMRMLLRTATTRFSYSNHLTTCSRWNKSSVFRARSGSALWPPQLERDHRKSTTLLCCRWLSSNSTESDEQIKLPVRERRPRTSRKREPTGKEQRRLTGYLAYCETRWNENFRKLRAFLDRSNRKDPSVVPFPDDRHLRMWLVRQRHEFQRRVRGKPSFLTDQRLQKLNSIGFTMQTKRERSWDKIYQQLCDYVNRNNGLFPYDAPSFDSLDAEGKRLFEWCERQRCQYNLYQKGGKWKLKAYMTDDRIARLNKIDFTWSIRESIWDGKYEELKAYYEHHGNCLVPAEYVANPVLAKWVETQRRQYFLYKEKKQTSMTNRRLALLNRLDFAWDANEARWQLKYEELKLYVQMNGYGIMPRYKDQNVAALYRWLRYQHKAYHKLVNGENSSMTPERQAMLELLGVVWTDTK
jgi:Helicase associated domain